MANTTSAPTDKAGAATLPANEAARRLGVDYAEFQAAERLLAFGLSQGEAIPDQLITDFALVRARIGHVAAGGDVSSAEDVTTLAADFDAMDALPGEAVPKTAPKPPASPASPSNEGGVS